MNNPDWPPSMTIDVAIASISAGAEASISNFRVMKALYNTQNTAPGRRFDNPAISLIVHWMHPLRLKAFRGFAASAALFVATTGCETDGGAVPVRTAGI